MLSINKKTGYETPKNSQPYLEIKKLVDSILARRKAKEAKKQKQTKI